LHNIGCFSHEDVVSRNFVVLKVFGISDKFLEKYSFSVFEKIEESFKLSYVSLFCNVSEWTVFELWKLVSFFEDIGHHVFADFNHQNSVISFSSKR